MPVIGPLGPVGPVDHPALFPPQGAPASDHPFLPPPVIVSDDKKAEDNINRLIDIDLLQDKINHIVENGGIRVAQTPSSQAPSPQGDSQKDVPLDDFKDDIEEYSRHIHESAFPFGLGTQNGPEDGWYPKLAVLSLLQRGFATVEENPSTHKKDYYLITPLTYEQAKQLNWPIVTRIVGEGYLKIRPSDNLANLFLDNTQPAPAQEGSGDKQLQNESGGARGQSYPTSGDGPLFKPEPRLGQDEDAAAWPFGEGKDDIDPKWGKVRDKLKKQSPCEVL